MRSEAEKCRFLYDLLRLLPLFVLQWGCLGSSALNLNWTPHFTFDGLEIRPCGGTRFATFIDMKPLRQMDSGKASLGGWKHNFTAN